MPAHADLQDPLPREPIDRLIGPLERFLHVQAAGGIVLLGCAALALALANSPWQDAFLGFWQTELSVGIGPFELRHSLRHWINDALMAVFFFVIGLEVKREVAIGELRDPRRAALPVAAALGGMLAPAAIFLALQGNGPAAAGWGIPMATDIAFVVGCLALLGPRVPLSLRVLLLSLAIADDIGAIVVIAIGYTKGLDLGLLAVGLLGFAGIRALARLGVRSFLVYTVAGAGVWLAFHESGVHATIAGVVLGLLTPAKPQVSEGGLAEALARASEIFRGERSQLAHGRAAQIRRLRRVTREAISPLEYLEARLHPWVGFVIMPLFALANAGVPVSLGDFAHPVALAVAAGLVVGKPLGILAFSWLAIRTGLASRPPEIGWPLLVGAGSLAGIGFTMALFIAGLALEGELLDAAKIGTLGGSVVSAALGMTLLAWHLPRENALPPRDAAA
jgi:NhaA family Na+:H+ antiporter